MEVWVRSRTILRSRFEHTIMDPAKNIEALIASEGALYNYLGYNWGPIEQAEAARLVRCVYFFVIVITVCKLVSTTVMKTASRDVGDEGDGLGLCSCCCC